MENQNFEAVPMAKPAGIKFGARAFAVFGIFGLLAVAMAPVAWAYIAVIIAQITSTGDYSPGLTSTLTNTSMGTLINSTSVDFGSVPSGSTITLDGYVENLANNNLAGMWMQVQYTDTANDFVNNPAEFTGKYNGVTMTGTCALNGSLYMYTASTQTFGALSNSTFTLEQKSNPFLVAPGTVMTLNPVSSKAC